VVRKLIPFFEAITLVMHIIICRDRIVVTVECEVDVDVYNLLSSCGGCEDLGSLPRGLLSDEAPSEGV